MDDFEVGDGASRSINGDSYPATVIAKRGQRIIIQQDRYTCTKPASAYGADDAEYEYKADPNGPITVWSLRKNGRFRQVGSDCHSGWSLSQGRLYRLNPHV